MWKVCRRLSVVAGVLVVAACGSGSTAGTADPESPARPFILEELPADYLPVSARAGEDRDGDDQDWATDYGSDSPFIVLQQDDRRVKVEAFGLEYEGQAAESGQLPARGPTSDQWTFSERLRGDGIALRATSRDVGVAELDRLLEGVEAERRRLAPSVEDLPDGWEVVGGSDADVVMSMDGDLGPADGFGAIWVRGDPNIDGTPRLSAVSLAGHADVRAWEGDQYAPVNWFGDAHGELVEVDSHEAAFVVVGEWEGGPNHVLLSRMEDGSLLVLTSSGNELLSREQLIAFAASARPATAQEWQELEDQANRT